MSGAIIVALTVVTVLSALLWTQCGKKNQKALPKAAPHPSRQSRDSVTVDYHGFTGSEKQVRRARARTYAPMQMLTAEVNADNHTGDNNRTVDEQAKPVVIKVRARPLRIQTRINL
jgi:hypothetical protein